MMTPQLVLTSLSRLSEASVSVTPLCEYNCDYLCSVCSDRIKGKQTVNPLLGDDDDDVPWMGYTGGEPGVFPIQRFTETGYEIGTPATPTKPYVPPPFVEIQLNRIIGVEEIPIVGPEKLKFRAITTL